MLLLLMFAILSYFRVTNIPIIVIVVIDIVVVVVIVVVVAFVEYHCIKKQ